MTWHHMHADGIVTVHPNDDDCDAQGSGRGLPGDYAGPSCECPAGELLEFGHMQTCARWVQFGLMGALPPRGRNSQISFVGPRESEDRRVPSFDDVPTVAEMLEAAPKGRPVRAKFMIDDPVKHPSHYGANPEGIECIQVVQHMNFNRGNAVKYLWRAGAKGNEIEDLRKAIQYIEFEIARLEAKTNE